MTRRAAAILALAALGALPSTAHAARIGLLVLNTPPVALVDAYAVQAWQILTVPPPGVLANDLDLDGDRLTAFLASGPSNGTLTLKADGSFKYVPDAGFAGTDGFTYRASDGQASSLPALVTIVVEAAARPTPPPTPASTPRPTPPPTPTPAGGPGPAATSSPDPIPLPSASVPLSTPTVSPVPVPTLPPASLPPAPSESATPPPSVLPTSAPKDKDTPQPTARPSKAPKPTDASRTPAPKPVAGATAGAAPSSGPGSGGPSGGGPVEEAFDVPVRNVDLAPVAATFDGMSAFEASFVELGVPTLAMTGPGVLLLVALTAQALGAATWLPIVRRRIGGWGVRPRVGGWDADPGVVGHLLRRGRRTLGRLRARLRRGRPA